MYPLSRSFRETQSEHVYDFGVRYYSAIDLRNGINPYEKKETLNPDNPKYGMGRTAPVYFPLVMVLYIPLSFLKFADAQVVWLSFNAAIVCFSAVLLFRLTGWPVRLETVAGLIALVAGFLPILRNLDSGQINLLILLLLCLAMNALRSGRYVKAGIWLAMAVLVKPVPAILFVGLMLHRKWTTIISGLIAVGVSLGLSFVCFGANVNFSFFKRLIFSESTVISTWWSSQNLASFFLRLFSSEGGNPERTPWLNVPALAWIFWGICAFIFCYLTFKLTMKDLKMPLVVNMSLWLITGLLVSPRTWDHYFPWLLIPVVLLASSLSRGPFGVSWAVFAVTYCLLAFPAVKYSSLPLFHSGPLLFMAGSQTLGLISLYSMLARQNSAGYRGSY